MFQEHYYMLKQDQQMVFKDYNLSLNVTQLKLQRIDSSTVDKTISVTLNTAGLVKRYVYNSLYNDLIKYNKFKSFVNIYGLL